MINQRLRTSSAAALLVAVLGAASIAQVVLNASNATAATTAGRGGDGGSRGGNAGPSGPSGGDNNGGAGGSHDGGGSANVDCVRNRCPPRRPMRIVVERPMSDRCLMPERLVYDAWGRPFYVYCSARSQRPYYTE